MRRRAPIGRNCQPIASPQHLSSVSLCRLVSFTIVALSSLSYSLSSLLGCFRHHCPWSPLRPIVVDPFPFIVVFPRRFALSLSFRSLHPRWVFFAIIVLVVIGRVPRVALVVAILSELPTRRVASPSLGDAR